MPADLRERISADLRAVGLEADLANRFDSIGMRMRVTSSAELEKIVANERAALARNAESAAR
jgi:hypothetical protein